MPLPFENYVSARSEPQIQAFVTRWQLDWKTGGGDNQIDFELRRWCQEYADSAVSLLLALAEQSSSPPETTAIAEGLEWFMMSHGAEYWDVLNALCREFPRFREVMASVWGSGLSKDLRRKVEMWQT